MQQKAHRGDRVPQGPSATRKKASMPHSLDHKAMVAAGNEEIHDMFQAGGAMLGFTQFSRIRSCDF
jgi:hypothetical protein